MLDADIVIDTSAIIAVVLNEPEKPKLIEHTIGTALVAPHSVHWEIGNALSAMLKRKRITLEEAQAALVAYRQIPIHYVDVDLEKALAHSIAHGIYVYDAYLIEASTMQRCPLLTLDRGLIHAAVEVGIEVLEVSV